MKKYTREELIEKAIHHFERNPNEASFIATEDGQFFKKNPASQSAVAHHCKELNLQSFEITPADVEAFKTAQDSTEKPLSEMTLPELKTRAKNLEIKFANNVSKVAIIALIEEKEKPESPGDDATKTSDEEKEKSENAGDDATKTSDEEKEKGE